MSIAKTTKSPNANGNRITDRDAEHRAADLAESFGSTRHHARCTAPRHSGAMGWQNCHPHMFIIDDKKYEPQFDDEFGSGVESQDEAKFKLSSLVKANSEFEYFYDFGDNWHHRIIVSDISDNEIEASYCVGGERACPPEDCGGPYGYPDFFGMH